MVLAEAVQEGLDRIGPSISEAVIFYMQKKAAIQIDNHEVDPEVLDDCMKGIFGWGAAIVERKILECLYMKLQIRIKIKSSFAFADEVKKAQKLSDSPDLQMAEPLQETTEAPTTTRKVLTVNDKAEAL